MTPDAEMEVQRQLESAFAEFRESLVKALTTSAQHSVDQTIERLSVSSGPFNVDAADVEVTIHNISFSAPDGTVQRTTARASSTRPAAPSRSRGRRKPASSRSGDGTVRRGRPDGPVKTALIEAFNDRPGEDRTPPDLAETLERRGVQATTANLHQQLRRLTAGGIIERSGRGVYRLKPTS